MDRIINHPKRTDLSWLKEFEYHDLIPYSVALFMLWADVYILSTFVTISHQMHQVN